MPKIIQRGLCIHKIHRNLEFHNRSLTGKYTWYVVSGVKHDNNIHNKIHKMDNKIHNKMVNLSAFSNTVTSRYICNVFSVSVLHKMTYHISVFKVGLLSISQLDFGRLSSEVVVLHHAHTSASQLCLLFQVSQGVDGFIDVRMTLLKVAMYPLMPSLHVACSGAMVVPYTNWGQFSREELP